MAFHQPRLDRQLCRWGSKGEPVAQVTKQHAQHLQWPEIPILTSCMPRGGSDYTCRDRFIHLAIFPLM